MIDKEILEKFSEFYLKNIYKYQQNIECINGNFQKESFFEN